MKIKSLKCVGGTQIKLDRERLKQEIQVVVSTPGRIRDIINREYLKT